MNEREQKSQEKKRVKPDPAPTINLGPTGGQADAGGLPGDLIAANGASSVSTYASQLGDSHFQTAQRQAMAAKIGLTGSNRYLQQVMSQMQQEEAQAGIQPAAAAPEQAAAKDEKAVQAPGEDEAETAKPAGAEEAGRTPIGQQKPPGQAGESARPGAASRAESAAPPAQASVSGQRPDLVSERLESLAGMPPTERIAAAAQAGQVLPRLWAEEHKAVIETLPGALKMPMGVPTLKEVTGQEAPPQEKATEVEIAAAEPPEVQPAPEQPSDPKAEGKEFLERSQTAAEAQDREEQAQHPDQAQTRRHTNVSAGERPKANLTGPGDPARMEQKQAISGQEVGDLATQAGQAMQKDYGESAIYPTEPPHEQPLAQERAREQTKAPAAKEPTSWGDVAVEMAEQPQVQDLITQRREQYDATLQQAQQSLEGATQQQQRLGNRQEEAGDIAGQMRHAAAFTPDEQVQGRAEQWLGQGEGFAGQATTQQGKLEMAQAQAQGAIERTQERQAALPDTAEMATRMAESPKLQDTVNAEVMPDFEAQTAGMMAQHQERRAATQAEIDTKWSEAQTIMAEHEEQQRTNLADIQTRAQRDVAQIKQEWQAQNETVISDYQTQTEQTRRQGDQTIAETVTQGEQEADQVLTKAEDEAGQTKAAGENQASATISAGRARADAIMASVPPMREGENAEAEHAQAEAKARRQADEEIKTTEERAQEVLDQMEADVQAILDDANLTAAEKVQQVNDIVQQTIEDVNAIMEEKRSNATVTVDAIEAMYVCDRIQARLDEAVAKVSESLLADEVVAARVEEIKQAIADGAGNIRFDTSSLDDGTYPGMQEARIFRERMTDCLDMLMTRPAGLELIMRIMDDTETVTITADETQLGTGGDAGRERQSNGTPGPGSDSTVFIPPGLDDEDIVAYDQAGNEISAPVWLILGHELIHAAHNSAGTNARGETWTIDSSYGNLEEEETISTGDLTENDLREQAGVDGPRFGHDADVVGDLGSR